MFKEKESMRRTPNFPTTRRECQREFDQYFFIFMNRVLMCHRKLDNVPCFGTIFTRTSHFRPDDILALRPHWSTACSNLHYRPARIWHEVIPVTRKMIPFDDVIMSSLRPVQWHGYKKQQNMSLFIYCYLLESVLLPAFPTDIMFIFGMFTYSVALLPFLPTIDVKSLPLFGSTCLLSFQTSVSIYHLSTPYKILQA